MTGGETLPSSGQKAPFFRLSGLDPIVIGSVVVLIAFGLMAIFSVNQANPGNPIFRKQLMLLVMGVVPLLVFLLIPAQVWQRTVNGLYALNLGMLSMVLIRGSSGGGAQRWLDIGPIQFQPSEMSKIITVITLATFYAKRQEFVGSFWTFFLSFLHVLPPLFLIFRQPHLGATLTIFVTWLVICIVANVPWKYIVGFLAALAVFGGIAGATLLRGYQLERLKTLFSSSKDSQREHYQQDQAMIAIGVGGTLGQGYLKGEQRERRAVPEQHNDFIFTVIGEEGGLFGSALVLTAFATFFLRGWLLVLRMGDLFSRVAGIGVLTVLAFHWIVNMAMNLGIGPVVGLWLPFISYGGTALWLCLGCVGLLLNLNARSEEGVFSGGLAPDSWRSQD